MTLQRIQLSVNGRPVEKEVETRKNLADFLRHDLSLTGTHVGCEHGVCGSCTVLYNGEPVRSCLMLAVQADQAEITTVEGLAENGALNSLQQAFKRHHALQCGFCTPGFLITATALLRKSGPLDEAQVRKALLGISAAARAIKTSSTPSLRLQAVRSLNELRTINRIVRLRGSSARRWSGRKTTNC